LAKVTAPTSLTFPETLSRRAMMINVNVPVDLVWLVEVIQNSYRNGHPVVITDKVGVVLHGMETLQATTDTGVQPELVKIENIDRDEFENSDLPEFAEAVRHLWLRI
jgi:hypothetical protein